MKTTNILIINAIANLIALALPTVAVSADAPQQNEDYYGIAKAGQNA